MLLEFTEEQEALRRVVRDFCEREVRPAMQTLEHDLARWKQLVRRCGDLGLLAILDADVEGHVPAEHVTVGVVAEELARYDMGLATAVSGTGARVGLLQKLWDGEQRDALTARFSSGEVFLSVGLTEPDAGSDVTRMRARATRVPGGVRLSGEKNSVSGVTSADAVIVFAHETGQPERRFSAFLVSLDTEGVRTGQYRDLGWNPKGRGWMSMDEVFVPDGQRIGEPGEALGLMLNAFDYNRGILALICVGATRAALDETVRFTSERETFGSPLAHRQAVSFDVVDGITVMEAARYMSYRVLRLRDLQRPHSAESAMAKFWVPKVCADVLHRCITIHGHMGYTEELPLQRRLRDVIGFEIGDGTAEMMKLIVARKLWGREIVG